MPPNSTALYTNQFGEYINEKNGEGEEKKFIIKGFGNNFEKEKELLGKGYVNTDRAIKAKVL